MSGLSQFNCELQNSDSVDRNLLCPICQELMNRPVSILCGHSACKECMEQLISNQGEAGREKTCPLCRAEIPEQPLNISIPLSSIISKLMVRCTNSGCSWVDEHGKKERHQDNCAFLLRNCPNGCAGSHRRDSLENHLEICPHEKVPCRHCAVGVSRDMLDLHELSCQEKPGPCPLNCGDTFPRSHVHLHLNECPKRIIKCSVSGCHNYYPIGMEVFHNEDYQESHQALLKSKVEILQCAIYDKTHFKVTRELSKRKSFRWTVKKSEFVEKLEDIASPLFGFNNNTFQCLWKRTSGQNKLFLKMAFGSTPITVQARFALLKKDGGVKVFDTHCETLKEDEVIGAKEEVGPIENDQDLIIKTIIAVYKHT